MTPSDNVDSLEGRADHEDEGPAPQRRRRPLDSLERVRRELSKVYWDAKDGTLALDKAKALTYLLSQIAVVLKAETASETELAALLQQVRDKLGARG